MLQYNGIVLGIPIFIRDFGKYLMAKMEAIHHRRTSVYSGEDGKWK